LPPTSTKNKSKLTFEDYNDFIISETNNSIIYQQSSNRSFKTNDNLLNGMSDRTIDRDMFDVEFRKKGLTKQESLKKINNKVYENTHGELSNIFSKDLIIDNSIHYNKRKNEFEQEQKRKELFDEIFNNDNNISRIRINKKIFTTCLLINKTLLCKIKKSDVKMKYGKKATLYHLYTDFTNKSLLSCKKISNFTNTEYIFSIGDNPLECPNGFIIGKVVSKFFGNEFNIFSVPGNNEENKLIGTIDYVKTIF